MGRLSLGICLVIVLAALLAPGGRATGAAPGARATLTPLPSAPPATPTRTPAPALQDRYLPYVVKAVRP